jgi:DNA-directed RNA polymerase subunit RPC12/RpoP
MEMISGICRNCGTEFEFRKGRKCVCPSCRRPYSMKKTADKFDIRMKSGLTLSAVSAQEINEGMRKGRFLSTDFVSCVYTPWIELKDSRFIKPVKEKKQHTAYWVMLFVMSFLVNIILLGVIYLQHSQIGTLTN